MTKIAAPSQASSNSTNSLVAASLARLLAASEEQIGRDDQTPTQR